MLSVESLANVILNNCSSVSNKKIQKLSYYVYAWHLAIYKTRIADMQFEAWEHGPVCRQLYNRYKCYGWNVIPEYQGFVLACDRDIQFIQSVLKVYGNYTADELEKISHDEAPWLEAREGCEYDEASDAIILDSTMERFYSQQIDIKNSILCNVDN